VAVVNGDDDAVRYLAAVAFIHRSSHLLDIRDIQHGHTALHDAVIADRAPSVVRLLLVAGASPHVLSRRGQTPLMLACAQRRTRCLGPLTQPVGSSDKARLTRYCTHVGLTSTTQLPPPPLPVRLPDINRLDYAGTHGRQYTIGDITGKLSHSLRDGSAAKRF